MSESNLYGNRALVIVGTPEFKDALELNFKTYLNVSIDAVSAVAEAKKDIEENKDNYQLIVCLSEISGQKVLTDISEYMVKEEISIPILALGEDSETVATKSNKNIQVIKEADDIKELIKKAASILGITAKDMANIPTSKYYAIPIDHFYTLNESPVDVYIKLGKGDKTQYIKRVHSGEGLESKDIDRYKDKAIEELYVESSKRLAFINALTNELLKVLENTESSPQEAIKATEVTQDAVKKNIEVLGITPDIVKMSNMAIKRMTAEATKYPRVQKLLSRMLENKASFAYKHTQLTAYMCMRILKKMDWGKKEQIQTLNFVAFFHDVCLPNDELTKIHTNQELRDAELSKEEMETVRKHAQKAAETVHNYPGLPMGADNIIRQHHGVLNGLGFSDTFSGQLTPLSTIFIVAEECAHLVLKSEFEELNKPKILFALEQKFSTSRFKKMIEAVDESM